MLLAADRGDEEEGPAAPLAELLHRPGVLPEGVAPPWYSVGCAIFNVYIGAVAYWPMLRR
jgi:hypothetical protein